MAAKDKRTEDAPGQLNPYARTRLHKTIGGIIMALTGAAVAIISLLSGDTVFSIVGMVCIGVGSGIIHPTVLASWMKK